MYLKSHFCSITSGKDDIILRVNMIIWITDKQVHDLGKPLKQGFYGNAFPVVTLPLRKTQKGDRASVYLC